MIITKSLDIKTTNKNIKYYNKYFPTIKSGDSVNILPEQLPLTSKNIIEVECDKCHIRYKITYYSYIRNINSGNYYCKKCSYLKSEITNLNKYGFKHPMQSNSIKEKTINTNIEKYGVEYPSQNKEIRNKIQETCKERYGETSYMKTEEFKNISKDMFKKKFIEIRNKIENTCIEKYGFKSHLSSDIIKEKIFKTKKLKYGNKDYNNRVK